MPDEGSLGAGCVMLPHGVAILGWGKGTETSDGCNKLVPGGKECCEQRCGCGGSVAVSAPLLHRGAALP